MWWLSFIFLASFAASIIMCNMVTKRLSVKPKNRLLFVFIYALITAIYTVLLGQKQSSNLDLLISTIISNLSLIIMLWFFLAFIKKALKGKPLTANTSALFFILQIAASVKVLMDS